MPTYTVHARAGRLNEAQKQQLASDITGVHRRVTGAQGFFAQVLFVEVPAGHWFVGGAPLAGEQLFIQGQIRAGRPAELKRRLLEQMLDAACRAAALEKNQVWGYIAELPPAQMAEYGHILPEPGSEASWLAALPEEDRRRMESTGTRD